MTKINKLEMQGFKSFAKKTELIFNDSFNCIIGPNGSGKSNVLDALCFVLGKSSSKALRAEKSSNLIYNGGKSKNPAKEGMVSIYFDNEEGEFPIKENHLKITRIIKQSGQGIYKINDKTVTRQQVLDIMSHARINPNGYNIILQGDIVRIVEISPDERRKIVEEISGISVYEDKKHKAVRELDKVEESLKEVEIILKEKQIYIKELKRDRDQALKYKELEEKIAQNKASYLNIQITKINVDKSKKDESISKVQENIDKLAIDIDKLKKESAEKKIKIDAINNEIEEKGEKEQVELNKQVESLRVDLATYKTRIENCKQQIAGIGSRKDQLKANISEIDGKAGNYIAEKDGLEKKHVTVSKNLKEVQEAIAAIRKKNNVEGAHELEQKMEEFDKIADTEQEKISKLREKQQELFREKDKIEMHLEQIDETIAKVKNVAQEHKDELANLRTKKSLYKSYVNDLNKCLDNDSSFASQLGTARGRLQISMEELSKLKARNISIAEALGASNAVTKILEDKQKFRAFGTVSDLGKVSSKYALALEIAAGGKIKGVVVQDDKAASECIRHLKTNKLGIASFLPLNKIRGVPVNSEAERMSKLPGVYGMATNLVTYDSRFKDVFSYVFGNTLVVENIDTARRIGINKAKMVTLDGDLVELSGAMHGGHRSKQRNGIGFKEQEVSDDIDKYEADVADMQNVISTLEKKREDNEEDIIKLRESKANLEGEIMATEKKLHLQSDDTSATGEQKKEMITKMREIDVEIDDILEEISTVNRKLADAKIQKSQIRQKLSSMRNPRVLAELNTYEQKRDELKEESIKMTSRIQALDGQITTIIGPEKTRSDKIMKQLDREEGEFDVEIKKLNSLITTSDKNLIAKEEQQKKFYSQFKGLFNEKSELNEWIQKADSQMSIKNDRIRDDERKINAIHLELARIKAELSVLTDEFEEYKGVELVDKPVDQLKKEIADFDRMVKNIGNVNMKALEVYDRINNEYDNLVEKKETLSTEKNDVLVLMNEIESKKQEMFMETFDKISDHFKRIFKSLSTKGEAFLELENPKNVFDGGLRIKVKLSGKKFMDIRSLSGGEKTMTALAFIFSVLEFEPAPFYVLDEVDAALDKRNAERLADLVRKYTGRAQYVLISHNDGVISEADSLYGVTMNEDGMSKVISLKV